MNAFDDARTVEAKSFAILMPWIEMSTDDGRYVLTEKGRLSRELQCLYGDVIAQVNGDVVCIEVKAEVEDKYGNFFLEEWSNRSRYTRGWLDKLDTDYLFYHFIKDDLLYVLNFPALRHWAFVSPGKKTGYPGRLYDYPSREQKKRAQMNDTWGRCARIADVLAEVPHEVRHPANMQQMAA